MNRNRYSGIDLLYHQPPDSGAEAIWPLQHQTTYYWRSLITLKARIHISGGGKSHILRCIIPSSPHHITFVSNGPIQLSRGLPSLARSHSYLSSFFWSGVSISTPGDWSHVSISAPYSLPPVSFEAGRSRIKEGLERAGKMPLTLWTTDKHLGRTLLDLFKPHAETWKLVTLRFGTDLSSLHDLGAIPITVKMPLLEDFVIQTEVSQSTEEMPQNEADLFAWCGCNSFFFSGAFISSQTILRILSQCLRLERLFLVDTLSDTWTGDHLPITFISLPHLKLLIFDPIIFLYVTCPSLECYFWWFGDLTLRAGHPSAFQSFLVRSRCQLRAFSFAVPDHYDLRIDVLSLGQCSNFSMLTGLDVHLDKEHPNTDYPSLIALLTITQGEYPLFPSLIDLTLIVHFERVKPPGSRVSCSLSSSRKTLDGMVPRRVLVYGMMV
jgi:hypothetical protein